MIKVQTTSDYFFWACVFGISILVPFSPSKSSDISAVSVVSAQL